MGNRKQGTSEEHALSEAQMKKLWSKCLEPEDQVLVGLCAFCGLRVSEATHLRQSWLREGEIVIPSRIKCSCWDCHERGYWSPKTKSGIRRVPVPGFLLSILEKYLANNPQGLQVSRRGAYKRIVTLGKRAELPVKVFPHALRATCATLLGSRGFTAVELCAVMGWSRLEIGEHYVRISAARQSARIKMSQIWD